MQGLPEAAGRGAAPPRQALAALKSRPGSVPGVAGIKLCTQVGACASPLELGGVFPQLVTVKGVNRWWPVRGPGGGGAQIPAEGPLGPDPVWEPGGHVDEFPGRRSGLGSASLTL